MSGDKGQKSRPRGLPLRAHLQPAAVGSTCRPSLRPGVSVPGDRGVAREEAHVAAPVALLCSASWEEDAVASAPGWHRCKGGPSAVAGLWRAERPLLVCTLQRGAGLQSACAGPAAVGDPEL